MYKNMFKNHECSYSAYREILKRLIDSGKYVNSYEKAMYLDEFILLRHDIEFSVDRAYNLSLVENEFGITSNWFVQFTNNTYNAFSDKNRKLLRAMYEKGHKIGLHYHRSTDGRKDDVELLKKDIVLQAEILSKMLELPIESFSFHRPLKEHLEANIKIPGLINAYEERFFTFMDNNDEEPQIKYIADSNHQWKYGFPTREYFEKYSKVHLLIHPLSWTENGATHVECFREIVQEKHDELVVSIETEWKTFDELRDKL